LLVFWGIFGDLLMFGVGIIQFWDVFEVGLVGRWCVIGFVWEFWDFMGILGFVFWCVLV